MRDGEYGIVANVIEVDSAFRLGAKAWMANCYSGGDRATWIAMTRGNRVVTKDASTSKFGNFRCAWLPEHLREHVFSPRGSRSEMEKKASFWNKRSDEERATHPNRKFQTPNLNR